MVGADIIRPLLTPIVHGSVPAANFHVGAAYGRPLEKCPMIRAAAGRPYKNLENPLTIGGKTGIIGPINK